MAFVDLILHADGDIGQQQGALLQVAYQIRIGVIAQGVHEFVGENRRDFVFTVQLIAG